MINKQNIWFLTLFSLILVLSIYYLTIGDDKLSNLEKSINNESAIKINTNEEDILAALRVASDEERLDEMNVLQEILLNEQATPSEKSDAFQSLKEINTNRGKEEKIEQLIKEKYSLDSFVKIKEDQINVVIVSKKHDNIIANNIMRSIQELYQDQKYITIKFN